MHEHRLLGFKKSWISCNISFIALLFVSGIMNWCMLYMTFSYQVSHTLSGSVHKTNVPPLQWCGTDMIPGFHEV